MYHIKRELKFISGKLKRNPKNPILLSLLVTFFINYTLLGAAT